MKLFTRIYQGYCYLFYLDYLWQSQPGIRLGNPVISATYVLASLFLINFLSLLVLLQITLFGTAFLNILTENKLYSLILVILPIAFLHNFLLLNKNKYKKIIRYYEKYPISTKRGAVIHWAYVIGSVAIYIVLLFVGVFLSRHNFIPLIKLVN